MSDETTEELGGRHSVSFANLQRQAAGVLTALPVHLQQHQHISTQSQQLQPHHYLASLQPTTVSHANTFVAPSGQGFFVPATMQQPTAIPGLVLGLSLYSPGYSALGSAVSTLGFVNHPTIQQHVHPTPTILPSRHTATTENPTLAAATVLSLMQQTSSAQNAFSGAPVSASVARTDEAQDASMDAQVLLSREVRTKEPFPEKLHRIITDAEREGKADVISFSPEGNVVVIGDRDRLTSEILHRYFRHGHWPSFQRQLYMYGFEKLPKGAFRFRHPFFHRDNPELLQLVARKARINETDGNAPENQKRLSFPQKLFKAVTECDQGLDSSILSWVPDGKAFRIHKPRAFETLIIPKYFDHGKISSFRRQLIYYGFTRAIDINNEGAYQHPFFIRGRPDLVYKVRRSYATNSPQNKDIEISDGKIIINSSGGSENESTDADPDPENA